TNHNGNDTLYVFTDATAFRRHGSCTKFGAFALLNHKGDFKAAAADLSRQGYGTFLGRTRVNGEWKTESLPNPCPKGVKIVRPGEPAPVTQPLPAAPESSSRSEPLKIFPADDDGGDNAEVEDHWPEISTHAFYGVAGEFVQTADPQTEADPVAVLVQML